MVPPTVTAGPPAEMVVPSIENAEGSGVNVSPATVYTLLGKASGGVGREMVLLPISKAPFWPRLMMVPLIVTAGPSAEMTVPATEKAEGSGVKVWPATVNASLAEGEDAGVLRAMVVLPIANAPD